MTKIPRCYNRFYYIYSSISRNVMKKQLINLRLFFLPMIFALVLQCRYDTSQKDGKFRIISDAITNVSHPYYIDISAYPENRKSLPIGVFDSGTGGLTVLNTILELDEFNNTTHEPGGDGIPDFEKEYFIYLADEANMPYGKYNDERKADFLRELVLKDVLFLLGRRFYNTPDEHHPHEDKEAVKSIVIACNTATAYGLETVDNAMDYWGLGVEITGIIEAGAKSALSHLNENNIARSIIGVLATEGTCTSGGYPATIKKIQSSHYPDLSVEVVQQAGMGLAAAIDGDINYIVPEVSVARDESEYFGPGILRSDYPVDLRLWEEYRFENGKGIFVIADENGDTVAVQLNSVLNYTRYMVTHFVQNATQLTEDYQIHTVILGCTHYPFIEKEILEHFIYLKQLDERYDRLIPDNISLIDPSKALAISLYEELRNADLWGNGSNKNSQFYISTPNYLLMKNKILENGEFPYDWKYGRDINTPLQFIKHVPLSEKWIDEAVRKRMMEKIPTTYDLIPF